MVDRGASFGETNWWVVSQAGQPSTAGADAARESLCRSYWWPVFFYLRRAGYCFEDAQDLTQGFFAGVLGKNSIQRAEPNKGKFRSFLLMMLKRFLADNRDRTNRQKRGGGKEIISLDSGDTKFRKRMEPADALTPERAFERSWASSLLGHAMDRLSEEMAAGGRKGDFEQLKPLVACEGEQTYSVVAQKLAWSEANVKVTVHRFRRRLGELLREEIAKTAETPEEVEEEIRDLFSAFG